MTLWGSVIDPEQAQVYDVPVLESTLPPLYDESDTPVSEKPDSTTSTQYAKPTEHLPGDHGDKPGEADQPAFPSGYMQASPIEDEAKPAETSPAETPSTTPTPDEGWFDISNLMKHQGWFFVALGAVVLFGAGAGLFFWRRAVRRRRQYTSLPAGDDMVMSSISGGRSGPRSKELYAAFDEDEDEDEDADEETGLKRGMPSDQAAGLGYHSGFLDDEDTAGAGAPPARYKDEPEPHEHEATRADSPGSGSTGDWEHASQEPSH